MPVGRSYLICLSPVLSSWYRVPQPVRDVVRNSKRTRARFGRGIKIFAHVETARLTLPPGVPVHGPRVGYRVRYRAQAHSAGRASSQEVCSTRTQARAPRCGGAQSLAGKASNQVFYR